ncbi:hypothetical protein [Arsenophonus nasoniae]|uniref:hypothetical protein n=1 Tax=Arsenophonus nasoniae TaxID=638 RepID=UPI00387A65D9
MGSHIGTTRRIGAAENTGTALAFRPAAFLHVFILILFFGIFVIPVGIALVFFGIRLFVIIGSFFGFLRFSTLLILIVLIFIVLPIFGLFILFFLTTFGFTGFFLFIFFGGFRFAA